MYAKKMTGRHDPVALLAASRSVLSSTTADLKMAKKCKSWPKKNID